MTRVLVTGATGFVGRALCDALTQSGYLVRAVLRKASSAIHGVAETAVVGDISRKEEWDSALEGVDAVMHIAARAHVLADSRDSANLYFETNAESTRRLAHAAARCGVRRLVFMSSIKVNGEATTERPFTSLDIPCPSDAYGASKLMAERYLAEIAAASRLQTVIVRSPLVYGPGVRANFLRLMRWVDKERLLPLGAVTNRRSLVGIWNLCDFLVRTVQHPLAAGNIWLISDGDDRSTPSLVRCIGESMGRRVRLIPVPIRLLKAGGQLIGRGAEVERLCGSLVLDISSAQSILGWRAPVGVDEGIARTVNWYLREGRSSGA